MHCVPQMPLSKSDHRQSTLISGLSAMESDRHIRGSLSRNQDDVAAGGEEVGISSLPSSTASNQTSGWP